MKTITMTFEDLAEYTSFAGKLTDYNGNDKSKPVSIEYNQETLSITVNITGDMGEFYLYEFFYWTFL